MDQEQAKILLEKYLSGEATEKECALIEQWYTQLSAKLDCHEPEADPEATMQAGLSEILTPAGKFPWFRTLVTIAASLILLMSIILLFHKREVPQLASIQPHGKKDLSPGGNKAFITLADGKKISLTDAKNGQLASESGQIITKTTDGQLVYQASKVKSSPDNSAATTALMSYNTIETPKGGQYQVLLPDGTKIWLNAASAIKYPSKFTGKERQVELSGEAYFEVAANPHQPFIVKTENQKVIVLGTHFNINSYRDERETITTLLEGSVKVSSQVKLKNSEQYAMLKPGEQAVIQPDGNQIKVRKADMETALGWKNGYIIFNETDIQTIMRQVSRWYNIDIHYEGKIPQRTFTGRLSRNSNLSALLKIMELSNIHFQIKQQSGITSLIIKSP